MKINKLISSVLILGTMGSVATAATISINFTRNPSSTDIASADSAGVESVANWNNLDTGTTTAADLTADTGDTTAVGFTRAGGNPGSFQGGAVSEVGADNRLMSDYIDVTDTNSVTYTFTGIVPTMSTYDVIVYTAGGANAGRFGDYTIGGTTIRSTDTSSFDSAGAGFVESTGSAAPATGPDTTVGNYVRFTGITGSSFSLSVVGANPGTSRAPINGIQIVGVAVPVPEPSSTALLGLGGLALILRRRK